MGGHARRTRQRRLAKRETALEKRIGSAAAPCRNLIILLNPVWRNSPCRNLPRLRRFCFAQNAQVRASGIQIYTIPRRIVPSRRSARLDKWAKQMVLVRSVNIDLANSRDSPRSIYRREESRQCVLLSACVHRNAFVEERPFVWKFRREFLSPYEGPRIKS